MRTITSSARSFAAMVARRDGLAPGKSGIVREPGPDLLTKASGICDLGIQLVLNRCRIRATCQLFPEFTAQVGDVLLCILQLAQAFGQFGL